MKDDGYTVARLAPSQQPLDAREAIDAVNLIAFKAYEVLFVAVRTERRVSGKEARRLHEMKSALSKHSRVVEWHWPSRAQEPEETMIA